MKNAWTRLGLPICLLILLIWLVRPGGSGFLPVPIERRPAPPWTMTNVHGAPVSSTNFAGQVVVLNFWATWCPPCIREIPDLQAFHAAHATNGVVVIGASVDTAGPETVRSFVARNHVGYPVVMAHPEVLAAFGAEGPIPSTFIIDREGRFAARYVGALPRAELEKVVRPLLTRQP